MLAHVLANPTAKKIPPRWTAALDKPRLRAMAKRAVVAGMVLTLVTALAMLINRLYADARLNEEPDVGPDATHLRGGVAYADSQGIYKSIKFH